MGRRAGDRTAAEASRNGRFLQEAAFLLRVSVSSLFSLAFFFSFFRGDF
uniref:Transmembrane protein n=1 Tax=Arundo donax TaxID=35708 RepID=A0A0A9G423_ARUDO